MNKYDDEILKYFDGQLSADEKKAFKHELEVNSDLKSGFENYREVNKLFTTEDELIADQDYFNEIIPLFRKKKEKEAYISPIRKISLAFASTLLIFSSYLLFQNLFFQQSLQHYSIQSFTDNLSAQELAELADYISEDYWNQISTYENHLIFDATDFSIEGVVSNISEEEGLMILSDYEINDIYSIAGEKELEIVYNEILTKRIN